ncbi:DegV family protein [uncultured Clostridium sp.]|uniref:DegV family protein n=1 Tax=uncultured Clostridium sp. TaxID=59620 RepID=UPI00321750A3
MKKVKIITDSTCDLPKDLVKSLGVHVIPLQVTINNNTYLDGIDIDVETFFQEMEKTDELPKTSQIPPAKFESIYKEYIHEEYEIISLHLSSKMSGTYQSALIAKDMVGNDKIHVIDSQNVTSGLGILVLKACKLRDEGKESKEIISIINDIIPNIKSTLNFQSLDNLVKGGRLSKATAFVGGLLGIKLNLAVENGEMVVRDKVRGSKKALKCLVDYLEQCGISQDVTPIVLNAAVDEENRSVLNGIIDYLKEHNIEFIESEVGCVVGTHSGKNACGIFFIGKN